MFGKGLYILSAVLLLTSCHFREILSNDEYIEAAQARIDFHVDWSRLDKNPTGLTLYCYPTDDSDADNKQKAYCYHTNTVEHIEVVLPDNDYSVICFNQSEAEFSKLNFDFSTFEGASVTIKTPEEYHGAYGSTLVVQPEDFAAATMASVKKGQTRGYNATNSLMPQPPIKPMQVEVYVIGLTNSVQVTGKLTNLSRGVKLHGFEPKEETYDQILEPSDWTIEEPKSEELPGKLSTTFGTFGLPKAKNPVRSMAESGQLNILSLLFRVGGKDMGTVALDFTGVLQQMNEDVMSGNRDGYDVVSGSANTVLEEGDDNETHVTENGTIVLKKPVKSSGVSVESWGDTTLIVLKL